LSICFLFASPLLPALLATVVSDAGSLGRQLQRLLAMLFEALIHETGFGLSELRPDTGPHLPELIRAAPE
jgi:hypothetical protein